MADDTPAQAEAIEADEAGKEEDPTAAADTSTDDVAEKAPIQLEDEEEEPSLMAEFWMFLKEEKKWWLAPIVIVLVLLSTLFIFAQGSGVAPFIYTLF